MILKWICRIIIVLSLSYLVIEPFVTHGLAFGLLKFFMVIGVIAFVTFLFNKAK